MEEIVTPLENALVFLINATLGIYIFLVMLQFLLNYFRAGFRDAPSQFILQITRPPLKLLYNIIPSLRNIDFAAFVLMLTLQMLKLWLTLLLYDRSISAPEILSSSLMNLLLLLLQIFFGAIIIQVIFNWIALISNNHSFYNTNPLNHILYHITEPLLSPVRRQLRSWGMDIPGGVDISPLIVSIVLWTGIILLS